MCIRDRAPPSEMAKSTPIAGSGLNDAGGRKSEPPDPIASATIDAPQLEGRDGRTKGEWGERGGGRLGSAHVRMSEKRMTPSVPYASRGCIEISNDTSGISDRSRNVG